MLQSSLSLIDYALQTKLYLKSCYLAEMILISDSDGDSNKLEERSVSASRLLLKYTQDMQKQGNHVCVHNKKFNFSFLFSVLSQTKNNPQEASNFINALFSKQSRQDIAELSLDNSTDSIQKYALVKSPKILKLNPIVFTCSEFRGVSKAGGISIMVADLT